MNPSQLVALKADIDADPVLAAYPNNSDGAFAIAAAYNMTAVPDYWAWRTAVTEEEFVNSTSVEGTTFDWTGTGFITRSAGERDTWSRLFGVSGTVNPSLSQVRKAFADILSGGTAPAPANRAHMLVVARQKLTRAEKLFSVAGTGPGNNGANPRGDTTNPDVMIFEGFVTYQDILQARAV